MIRTVLLATAFASCLLGQQPAAGALRIGTDPWIAWTPLHIAADKGFFAAESVQVEVVNYTGGETPAAFAAGRVDLATMMVGTAIGHAVEGHAPVILAEIDWSHGGDKIVTRGDALDPQRSPRIGIYEQSPAITYFLHRYLAERTGHRRDQFELVLIEDADTLVANFVARRFDAVICYDPYVQRAQAAPGARLLATTADFPGVMPEAFVTTRERLAKLPAASIDGVLRAWIRAAAWCADSKNRPEMHRIVRERMFPEGNPDSAAIDAMLATVRIHDVATLRVRNAADGPLVQIVGEMLDFAQAGATKKITATDLIDTSALARALPPQQATTAAPAK
ncbi:MAG: ABC transporter substrate-binding protein [Planctomycetes bacterium]|nr:ABC transporter substrate-binding protein [Planctomycetota bacterium]